MSFNILFSEGQHENYRQVLGTEPPAIAKDVTFVLRASSDPDSVPDPVSYKLFTIPQYPGFLFRVVASVAELNAHDAAVCISDVPVGGHSNYITLVTKGSVNSVIAYNATAGALSRVGNALSTNDTTGTTVSAGGYPKTVMQRMIRGKVFAVVGKFDFGAIMTGTTGIPSATGAWTNYRGWVGQLFPFANARAALRAQLPQMLAEAPGSKERRCIQIAFDRELVTVPASLDLTAIVGLTAWGQPSNVGDLSYRFGLLSHNTDFVLPASHSTIRGQSLGIAQAPSIVIPCLASQASIPPAMGDEVISKMLLVQARVTGNDFRTMPGLAGKYSGDSEENHRDAIKRMSDHVGERFTPQMVQTLVDNSARRAEFPNDDGTTTNVGSTGAINLYSGGASFTADDPIFGDAFAYLQDRIRRVYARAEDVAKELYG